MFTNVESLIEEAKKYDSVAEMMIAIEIEQTGRERAQIIEMMEHNLATMLVSAEKGLLGENSVPD